MLGIISIWRFEWHVRWQYEGFDPVAPKDVNDNLLTVQALDVLLQIASNIEIQPKLKRKQERETEREKESEVENWR